MVEGNGEGNHIGHGFDGWMGPSVPFADLGDGDGCLGVSDESLDWGSIPGGPDPTSGVQIQASEGVICGMVISDSGPDNRLEAALEVSVAFFFLLGGSAYDTPPLWILGSEVPVDVSSSG